MRRDQCRYAIHLIALLSFAGPVYAGAIPHVALHDVVPAAVKTMAESQIMATPRAYAAFCQKYASQCASDGHHDRISLTPETWRAILEVNSTVNDRISPDATKGAYDWSLETTTGNCNDYAVQKRQALIARGLPASALSLAVVLTRSGEGHLVLTARTDRGDYVLDNLRRTVRGWNRTGYQFNRVQSVSDPQTWVHPETSPRGRDL